MASGKTEFRLDPMDVKLLLKDLGDLGTNVTKKTVIRRALMKAGSPMKQLIEANAMNALNDGGKIAKSFSWRSGTVRRGYLSMFIRSIPKDGGYLTTIFENATTDRYHKSGWWTGKIEDGTGKTTGTQINTKFIQRGFDAQGEASANRILVEIKNQVTKMVTKSRKLNNKK